MVHETQIYCRFMYFMNKQTNTRLWVPISSTGKVSYRRARDLGSNPVYTKNQLVS